MNTLANYITGFLFFLLIILYFPTSSNAQQLRPVPDSIRYQLNYEQLREYRSKRLSVVIETERIERIDITGERYTTVFGRQRTNRTITKSADEWHEWTPYRGFEPITEPSFFRISGYTKQFQKSKDYHRGFVDKQVRGSAVLTGIVGGVLTVSGLGGMSSQTKENRKISPETGKWLAGAGAGLILTSFLIPKETVRHTPHDNWAPVGMVRGIAQDYNYELYNQIKK